ncbi:MAG: cob(I)yrinic acid a,c-diamide adenosyltransferase [Arachnia sp.]
MSLPTGPGPRPPKREVDSLVLVNTGDGKGKSTAAFGMIMRAVARGWPVAVVQFVKSGRWRSGEAEIARQLGVDWLTHGDGFTWESADLDESAGIAREAWRLARERLTSGEYRLVVLDEVTYPITYGWVPEAEVIGGIRERAPATTVICTGRAASDALIDIADTVTEMRKIKHAYDTGVRARRGIDY